MDTAGQRPRYNLPCHHNHGMSSDVAVIDNCIPVNETQVTDMFLLHRK